jgi:hypothetical protein
LEPTFMGIDFARSACGKTELCLVRGKEIIDSLILGVGDYEAQLVATVAFVEKHKPTSIIVDQVSVCDPLLEQLRKMLWERGVDVATEGVRMDATRKRACDLMFDPAKVKASTPSAYQLACIAEYRAVTASGHTQS